MRESVKKPHIPNLLFLSSTAKNFNIFKYTDWRSMTNPNYLVWLAFPTKWGTEGFDCVPIAYFSETAPKLIGDTAIVGISQSFG
jgi:hypothetical protein